MQYSLNQRRGPSVQAFHNANLSLPLLPMNEHVTARFNELWYATTVFDRHLSSLFQELPAKDIINIRLLELNRHLTSLLRANPTSRPTIDHASINIGASRIRSKMESDKVLTAPFLLRR
jgi:hypothetical protein